MKLFVSSAIATLIAGTAFAGSLEYTPVEAAPVPVEVQSYSDVSWTGGYVGLQFGTGDIEASFEGESDKIDFDSFGLHAGYMYDLGQVVLGGELSFDRVSADGEDGGDADMARLRGIAGYDMGKFMPFLTLGGARLSGDGDSETGITYGIGAQYLVTDKFAVGLEYSRTSFSDIEGEAGLDADIDLIQLRGSFRF
jgi:opacity protein-like surface antigen